MRIACVATDGFEDRELSDVQEALEQAGHDVDVIAPREDEIAGLHGRVRIVPGRSIDDADPSQYDALFVPGGFSPDRLRADARFVAFARAFEDKPIFAICHGPQLLFTAGLLEGRTVTAWRTIQYDLERAGVHVRDQPVVVDERLVTSRQPADLPEFCRTALRVLEAEAAPVEIGKPEIGEFRD